MNSDTEKEQISAQESNELKEKQISKSRPVRIYLTGLFFVAFLLLLLSFFMQQRNHETLMEINTSLSESQSITELQLENQRIDFELKNAKKDYDTLQKEYDTLQNEQKIQKQQVQAMQWLNQIQYEAIKGNIVEVKELLDDFKASGLTGYLPEEAVEEDEMSPLEMFEAIDNKYN